MSANEAVNKNVDRIIRVLVVESNFLFAQEIVFMLYPDPFITVTGITKSKSESMHMMYETKPDVVLFNRQLFDMFGNELVDLARMIHLNIKIIVFVEPGIENDKANATQNLISDTLHKPLAETVLTQSIKDVVLKSDKEKFEMFKLTARQAHILNLASQGLSNKEIAYDLNLSVRTVESHIKNILERLEVRKRIDAILKWTNRE